MKIFTSCKFNIFNFQTKIIKKMDFNSERIISKNIYPTDEGNESKEMNLDDNEPENEEDIQANLIYSWGFSKYGQTGHDNTNYILSPSIMNFTHLINSENFSHNIDIEPVTGESHSGFIIQDLDNTSLYMFGKNIFGQLGLEENSYLYQPIMVDNLNAILKPKEKVKKVSLGGEHSLLLTQKNNIYSCGLNLFGQLGLGDFENRNIFTNVDIYKNALKDCEGEEIKDIAAGAQHSLFITNMNKLFYCGFNKNKFLGIAEDINLFTHIQDNKLDDNNINLIRASMNISGVLFEDKKTIGIFGQDLDLINKSSEIILIKIEDIEKEDNENLEIKDFKLGNEFIEVLLTNGNVYTCGINNKNQLGVEESIISKNDRNLVFYKVSLPEKIIQIEVGYDNSIVISISGKIYGWGSNYYGQICHTKKSSLSKPTLISNIFIKDLALYKISTGAYHTIVIYKGDVNNIPDEEPIFDIYKNKLSSVLEATNPDQEKAIDILLNSEQFNNELNVKRNLIKEKMKEIKEKSKSLGVVPPNELSSYSRGFENNFEIALDELEFDEENSEIGKGTFGDVLRGTWRGEEVAVKFLKGSMSDSPESVKQFIDECNILKNLHHPNILLFMGACITGPQYFFVTEYCDNGNLFEFLHIIKDNKLTYEDARRIALEIAYGMNYLHGFKPPILHRDLKSMNVLLDRNTTVKLADFGNTRSFQLQMTKQKGTFQWMAPEVIKGSTYSESSDVFSFGIIMNELVTRVPPYQGTDKKDVAKKVVNNPNYRPKYNEKKVPKDWIDIMVKCWQHDEKKRPTFDEVIELLLKAKLPSKVYIKQPA